MTEGLQTIAAPCRAASGHAPPEAPSTTQRLRAIACLFREGFDTQTIAGLLGADEAEVANAWSRLRATAGAAFVNGSARRRPGTPS